MDDGCYDTLTRLHLPHVEVISLEEFERGDAELLAAKSTRSKLEYYFTCTPSLPLYVLSRWAAVDVMTYLDADLYLFSDVAPVFRDFENCSIGITAHRFPPSLRHLEEYGLYNVGWLMFRNNQEGVACLEWWRRRCLEWCYDRSDGGRFADQKYLDEWPARFPGTRILEHPGLNAAPWNLADSVVHRTAQGVLINGQPLLCFHFHGFKRIWSWLYEPNLSEYRVRLGPAIRKGIYQPYLEEMSGIESELRAMSIPAASSANVTRGVSETSFVHWSVRQVRRWLRIFRGTIMRQYLIHMNGRVL